eukprot:gene10230-12546_t
MIILPNILLKEIINHIEDEYDRISFYQTLIEDRLQIPAGSIPNTVRSLSLKINSYRLIPRELEFQGTIVPGTIPSSVITLTIDSRILVEPGLIPESVTSIKITDWSYTTDGLKLRDLIPPSVKKLEFGFTSHYIDVLPPGYFPSTLEEISFVNCYYPHTLQPGVLPSSLKILRMGNRLKKLKIDKLESPPIIDLPPNLKELTTTQQISNFPSEELSSMCTLLKLNTNSLVTYVPPTIRSLRCNLEKIYKGLLPDGLVKLELVPNIESIEPNSIPDSVQEIVFYNQVNFKITENMLPPRLKTLVFWGGISYSIPYPIIPSTNTWYWIIIN